MPLPFNAGDLHSDIRAKINQGWADLNTLFADIAALESAVTTLQSQIAAKQDDLARPSTAEIQAGTATAERAWAAADISLLVNTQRPLTAPFANASGPQGTAPSGGNWKMTGPVSAVPVTNGWFGNYVNTSASQQTLTPIGGQCIALESGTAMNFVSVNTNKGIFVIGDGANLIVSGDIANV